MAYLDDTPGGREWLPVAKDNGLDYSQYLKRIQAGMPPEIAATKPLRDRTRVDGSVRDRCITLGVSRDRVYALRRKMTNAGHPVDAHEVLDLIENDRSLI